jgi:hypothetical protein
MPTQFSVPRLASPPVAHDNPFAITEGGRPPPVPRLLSAADFAILYAAFSLAWRWELFMDTSLTISWRLLGPEFEADVQKSFSAFLKALRSWLADQKAGLSAVYAYVHEAGPVVGTHTHLALFLPEDPSVRRRFRQWWRTWIRNATGAPKPGAIKVTCRVTTFQRWQHWRAFSYMVKGYDPFAVVLQSPDPALHRDRYLGDLVAYAWKDPGAPAVQKRFGVSDSLGTGAREFGLPDIDDLHECARSQLDNPYVDPFKPDPRKYHPALWGWKPGPFRSAYDRGSRDVRVLYPAEFVAMVDRSWTRPPYKGPMQLTAELESAMAYIRQLEYDLQLEFLDI